MFWREDNIMDILLQTLVLLSHKGAIGDDASGAAMYPCNPVIKSLNEEIDIQTILLLLCKLFLELVSPTERRGQDTHVCYLTIATTINKHLLLHILREATKIYIREIFNIEEAGME
ncbi:hypothetical protein ACJX0J_025368, partial [Zea mays]